MFTLVIKKESIKTWAKVNAPRGLVERVKILLMFRYVELQSFNGLLQMMYAFWDYFFDSQFI